MSLFQDALKRTNRGRPPVWFMRQAGRYHSHYRELRKRHSFLDICKKPSVSAEAALGPVNEFGYDAAIVFSDILFPLEVMGMGLRFDEGPVLDWHLESVADLSKLKTGDAAQSLAFQGEAIRQLRAGLSPEKGLLGFIGGPVTLFCYAVEGSHKGDLTAARAGLQDGRFEGFLRHAIPILAEYMALQARGGADTIAIFDTCAGEFEPALYQAKVVPALRDLMTRFKALCPPVPITYYSKGTRPEHWDLLTGLPIACLGVDWRHSLPDVLRKYGPRWTIQGNIDPEWLFLEANELERRLRAVFQSVLDLGPSARQGWVCGLGHGILPKTPESNVHLFLKLQRQMFGANT